MAQRVIDGFILEEAVVLCPECQAPFRTDVMVETRGLNSSDVVEADLHRVFPTANLRQYLLSLCPDCKYCAWTSQFQPFNIKPELVKAQGDIEGAKKYALAVKWARDKKQHSLDIAFIALNGLWCARESGEPDQLWLELAIFEHEKGLETSFFAPEDNGITHLIMAELYRQYRNFEAAMEHYKIAGQDRSIIKEILEHQQMLCSKGVSSVTALPLRITRLLFDVADATSGAKKETSVADAAVVFKPQPSKNEARVLTSEEKAALIPDAPLPKALQANAQAPANSNVVPFASPQAAPAPAAQPAAQAAPQTASAAAAAQLEAQASAEAETSESNSEDAAPLVAAISALFSAHSALLNSDGSDEDEDEIPAAAAPETVQPISARIAAAAKQAQQPAQQQTATPGQRDTNPNSAPPAMATNLTESVAPPAKAAQAPAQKNPFPAQHTPVSNVSIATNSKPAKQEEKPIDPANVIEISAFDPKATSNQQAKQADRPNSAARSAALNARAKSVDAAQNQPAQAPQASMRSRRRTTRKDRRASERTPGSQNVRQDHRVSRLPLSVGVINPKGWITDYNSGVATITPQPAPVSAPSSNYEEGLHDYEITGVDEENKKLPEMVIDDPTGYKGEDVPDHSNAISKVENYLSFSRRLYQRSYMRGYN
jgi:hypothetical protein